VYAHADHRWVRGGLGLQKWTGLVMEEFYRQGDEERRLGLPISPFMDREAPKLAQCQKGFLEFICLPLYEAFDGFVNVPEVFAQLQANAAYWASQVEAAPTGAAAAPAATAPSGSGAGARGSISTAPMGLAPPTHPPPHAPPATVAAGAAAAAASARNAGASEPPTDEDEEEDDPKAADDDDTSAPAAL
jgi:hypothetical protein